MDNNASWARALGEVGRLARYAALLFEELEQEIGKVTTKEALLSKRLSSLSQAQAEAESQSGPATRPRLPPLPAIPFLPPRALPAPSQRLFVAKSRPPFLRLLYSGADRTGKEGNVRVAATQTGPPSPGDAHGYGEQTIKSTYESVAVDVSGRALARLAERRRSILRPDELQQPPSHHGQRQPRRRRHRSERRNTIAALTHIPAPHASSTPLKSRTPPAPPIRSGTLPRTVRLHPQPRESLPSSASPDSQTKPQLDGPLTRLRRSLSLRIRKGLKKGLGEAGDGDYDSPKPGISTVSNSHSVTDALKGKGWSGFRVRCRSKLPISSRSQVLCLASRLRDEPPPPDPAPSSPRLVLPGSTRPRSLVSLDFASGLGDGYREGYRLDNPGSMDSLSLNNPASPLADSTYSCDLEGYYTSMHTDCGLRDWLPQQSLSALTITEEDEDNTLLAETEPRTNGSMWTEKDMGTGKELMREATDTSTIDAWLLRKFQAELKTSNEGQSIPHLAVH